MKIRIVNTGSMPWDIPRGTPIAVMFTRRSTLSDISYESTEIDEVDSCKTN